MRDVTIRIFRFSVECLTTTTNSDHIGGIKVLEEMTNKALHALKNITERGVEPVRGLESRIDGDMFEFFYTVRV